MRKEGSQEISIFERGETPKNPTLKEPQTADRHWCQEQDF